MKWGNFEIDDSLLFFIVTLMVIAVSIFTAHLNDVQNKMIETMKIDSCVDAKREGIELEVCKDL